jgi:hypothetical protein
VSLEPTGLSETFNDNFRLFCVQALPKCIAPDVHQRNVFEVMRLNPSQGLTRIALVSIQPKLA